MLQVGQVALNNAVHTYTGYTLFYANGLTYPRVLLTLQLWFRN